MMIKYVLIFLSFSLFCACHDMKEGYLITKNAEYTDGDTLIIRKIPDRIKDKDKIENQSPWMTNPIDGVLGTNPILFRLSDVKASHGGNARIFRERDLRVRGLGRLEVQLYPEAPRGRYVVSLLVSAGDYTEVLDDAFTFIIE